MLLEENPLGLEGELFGFEELLPDGFINIGLLDIQTSKNPVPVSSAWLGSSLGQVFWMLATMAGAQTLLSPDLDTSKKLVPLSPVRLGSMLGPVFWMLAAAAGLAAPDFKTFARSKEGIPFGKCCATRLDLAK